MPGRTLRGLLLAVVVAAGLPATAAGDSEMWAVGDGDAGAASIEVADRMGDAGDGLLYLGDVYETGTAEEFATAFDPVWGRFKSKTFPTPGNHDWGNRATGYDPYWGERAPRTGGGHYYAFEQDGWEFISLNSEEPTAVGSPQYEWLRQRLATPGTCRIAFFHAPRWSAGRHGDNVAVQPLWDLLAGRATLVLNGHDHNSQRAVAHDGITQLIAGAGGHGLYPVGSNPRIVWSNHTEYAALRLYLGTAGDQGGSAHHAFIAADDGAVLDQGSHSCTRTPLPPATNTARFTPDADTAVRDAAPDEKAGRATILVADRVPAEQSSLRFSVDGVVGPVRSARLRLYADNGSVDGPAVHATAGAWSEKTTTWADRPLPVAPAVADVAAIPQGTWISYDVTPLVAGNGTVDLTLAATSDDGVDLSSREAAGNPPELVVEYEPDAPPPDTGFSGTAGAASPSGSALSELFAAAPGATLACSVDGAPFRDCTAR